MTLLFFKFGAVLVYGVFSMQKRLFSWLDRTAQRIDGKRKSVFNEFIVNYVMILFAVVILLQIL